MNTNSLTQEYALGFFIDQAVANIQEEITKKVPALFTAPQNKKSKSVIDGFETFLLEKQYQNTTAFDTFLTAFKLEIEKQENRFSKSEILERLMEIRTACRESPFLTRAQTWPRGYQGDFETIDYIIKAKNRTEKGTFGYAVEDYFLKSDICRQHKNKVARQAQLIQEVTGRKNAAKIISIGCGTSEDVKSCIFEIVNSGAEITLVDVDPDALAFSLQQLNAIKEKVTPVAGNIYRIMRSLTEKYDLILIGGVFDYLNDKTIISVLSSLRNNLAENGKLFFTNIDIDNPYRVFMEYIGDWTLIERSKKGLTHLITQANWPENACHITKDNTGLTHLVELNYRCQASGMS